MALLERWTRGTFTAGGRTHPTFRQGSGPGVIVIHEIPGLTPTVARFGQDVVDAGFTVVMPSLVGTPGKPPSPAYVASSLARVCVSREFTTWATGRTSPIVGWLRSLARSLHQELAGPGVGAVGMCFSGGFALGMMIDERMAAPVLSQPSLPFAVGRARSADLGLSPEDRACVAQRAADGCEVLGLRYRDDRLVGDRFTALRELLGDAFLAIEFDGAEHSVLTEHRQEDGVRAVVEFLTDRLNPVGG